MLCFALCSHVLHGRALISFICWAFVLLCLHSNVSDPFSINFIYYYVLLMCFFLLFFLLLRGIHEIHVNILCVDDINDGWSRTHGHKELDKFYCTHHKPSSGLSVDYQHMHKRSERNQEMAMKDQLREKSHSGRRNLGMSPRSVNNPVNRRCLRKNRTVNPSVDTSFCWIDVPSRLWSNAAICGIGHVNHTMIELRVNKSQPKSKETNKNYLLLLLSNLWQSRSHKHRRQVKLVVRWKCNFLWSFGTCAHHLWSFWKMSVLFWHFFVHFGLS